MTKQDLRQRREWQLILEAREWPQAIRSRLAELGLSQEWLARQIGVSLPTMNRWLNGKGGGPQIAELQAIGRALAAAEIDSAKASERTPDVRVLDLRPIRPPLHLRRRTDRRLAPVGALAA